MKRRRTDQVDQVESTENDKVIEQAISLRGAELTEEERLGRLALEGMLREPREELIKASLEREKRKKLEIVELHSGAKFTIGEIERIVCAIPRPYAPLFSYEEPYYKEIYRIYYPERDYKEWPKPFYVGTLCKEFIYNRFDKAIFKALDFHNPIIAGRYRARKLFQHLNEDGQGEVVQFRKDVTDVSKTIIGQDIYGFRKKMWEVHKVPFQLDIFKEKKA